MKRHGDIFYKICAMENLREAHRNARKDKLFYKEVKMVDQDPDKYLKEIQEMLLNDTYEVSEYTVSIINDKGKERELEKLPYFPDRIIQWAIMLQIEPIFMETFCTHTCASIKDRGISKALDLLHGYLEDVPGTQYCLKIDVRKFYPSIDHDILKQLLARKIKDQRLLSLLYKIVDSVPGTGVPIGSYLSQYLANFYLAYFDHYLKEELHQRYVVRYMDDIIILSDSKEQLHEVRRKMGEYLETRLNLVLKDNWQVFPVDVRGIDFIGFRCFHGYTLLRKRTCIKFKNIMRRIQKKQEAGLLISYSEFCSANSYCGWLDMCNGYRLKEKYIVPVAPSLMRYYEEVIADGKKNKVVKINKYRKKLEKKGLVKAA
ncbi:group II intron-encoded protein LtrA [Lachnospiraceae bacterium]|nr:group II intron-encoded protein LtrA [Lachnospiraceae bacterium]